MPAAGDAKQLSSRRNGSSLRDGPGFHARNTRYRKRVAPNFSARVAVEANLEFGSTCVSHVMAVPLCASVGRGNGPVGSMPPSACPAISSGIKRTPKSLSKRFAFRVTTVV